MQGACSGGSCGLMVMTGIRLAPQATLTPWHAVLIIVGTLVLAPTKNKAGLDHCRCGGAWFGASVPFSSDSPVPESTADLLGERDEDALAAPRRHDYQDAD